MLSWASAIAERFQRHSIPSLSTSDRWVLKRFNIAADFHSPAFGHETRVFYYTSDKTMMRNLWSAVNSLYLLERNTELFLKLPSQPSYHCICFHLHSYCFFYEWLLRLLIRYQWKDPGACSCFCAQSFQLISNEEPWKMPSFKILPLMWIWRVF